MRDFENLKSGDKPVLNNATIVTILLVVIIMSQWFLNLATQAWFGRR